MAVDPMSEVVALVAGASSVLALGSGRSAITSSFRRAGIDVEVVDGDWPSIQLPVRHDTMIVEPVVDDAAAVLHCAVQHLRPGGAVVTVLAGEVARVRPAERFDLEQVGSVDVDGALVVVLRRTTRRTIHDVVFDVRARIDRVSADDLAARLRGDRGRPTVVDTRTATDRTRWGVIAGSIHVPRTVLEWHLDPANGYRHRRVTSLDQPLVVVCNGGYSSSLATGTLTELGFSDVADLVGGMRAWIGAGHPVVEPDHTHLDL